MIASPSVLERNFASLLIGTFSFLGLVACLYSIIVTTTKKQQITPFNIICLTRCSLNLIALSCYLFYQVPLAILGIRDPIIRRNAFFMCLIGNVYIILEHLCCLMAVNRFIAIYSWKIYQFFFKRFILIGIIVLIILYRITTILPFILVIIRDIEADCYLIFDGHYLVWVSICPIMLNDTATFTFFFIGFVALVNLLTFLRLLYLYVRFYFSPINFQCKTSKSNIKIKQNGVLFAQTICQDLLFMVDMFFMTRLGQISSNPFWQFICNDFTGLLVHSLDSVFLIIFQSELRQFCCKKKAQNQVIVLQNTF